MPNKYQKKNKTKLGEKRVGERIDSVDTTHPLGRRHVQKNENTTHIKRKATGKRGEVSCHHTFRFVTVCFTEKKKRNFTSQPFVNYLEDMFLKAVSNL